MPQQPSNRTSSQSKAAQKTAAARRKPNATAAKKTTPPPGNSAANAQNSGARTTASGLVRNRNAFYQNGYQLLIKVVIGQSVAIVVLVIALFLFAGNEPRIIPIGLTEDLRVIEIPSDEDPYLDNNRVRQWAITTLTDIYDWDYRNYRSHFTDVERNFTSQGFTAWLQSLDASQRVDYVTSNELLMSFTPKDAVVVGDGMYQGAYRWRLEVRGAIVYSATGRSDRSEEVRLLVDVTRVDIRRNGIGVAIDQIVERRAE